MPIYTIKLIERREVARNTVQFMFEKPNTFNYKPGQYGGFTLINPSEVDAGGITRRFSLLSTPDAPYIAIATRIQSSAYKRELLKLKRGQPIKFAGPTGTFILHEDTNIPAVLIAGGIGIAPFYSMVSHASLNRLQQQISLFYGNQTLADTPFLTELNQLQDKNPNLKLIATLTEAHDGWTNEQGFITDTMLKKYLSDLASPIYYVCGSKAMVTAIQQLLLEMGIDKNKIKVEDFPGY